jgi:hypothetical protein
MKSTLLIMAFVAGFSFIACEKPKDFIADNTTPSGVGYRPVSTNPLRIVTATPVRDLNNATLAAGTAFQTELQFFSESPVKEINFYSTVGTGAKTKVATFPYKAAFSQIKRMDTLLVPYTVPTAASGTSIKLDYELVNENALTLVRPATIKVQ